MQLPNVGDFFKDYFGIIAEVSAIDLRHGEITLREASGAVIEICPIADFYHKYVPYSFTKGLSAQAVYENDLEYVPLKGCSHELKDYVGLQETFKYCTKCDHKEKA